MNDAVIRRTGLSRIYAERGLDTVIVYPTGIIGPHDTRGSLFGRLVRYVAKPWRKSMPLMRCGYDFVDVRDVARGLVAAWENGTAGEEYILSGSDVQLADAVRMMAPLVGIADLTGPLRWVDDDKGQGTVKFVSGSEGASLGSVTVALKEGAA